ncbi:MAG: 50S ribosomal protein L29 [Candidatus Latescibacteria bacterium]|nr:50S ribosomal protein L29 [Candidatus Latescibacterota bacterium]
MKPHEIREKTLEEIKNDLTAAKENLRTLRFQLVTSQLEKTSLIKQSKKEIARLETIIKEHELGKHQLTVSNVKVGVEGEI